MALQSKLITPAEVPDLHNLIKVSCAVKFKLF